MSKLSLILLLTVVACVAMASAQELRPSHSRLSREANPKSGNQNKPKPSPIKPRPPHPRLRRDTNDEDSTKDLLRVELKPTRPDIALKPILRPVNSVVPKDV